MLNPRSTSFLKLLVPVFVLLVGCGMTNRIGSLVETATSPAAEEASVIQLPSVTSIAAPMEERLAMTAATPISMPSIDRAERILWETIDQKACRR